MESFSKNNNTLVSKLNSEELKEFKNELNKFYIDYRDSLDIDPNIQFGVEIEYDKLDMDIISDFLLFKYHNWNSISEKSLVSGGEVTSPILNDNKETWESLKTLCTFLRIAGASETEDVGSHVHVGADLIGSDFNAWKNLVYMIIAYENILFKYSSGEYTRIRYSYDLMCYPFSRDLYEKLDTFNSIENILKELMFCKYQSINFKNVKVNDLNNRVLKNTIEFRMPNGTLNEIIWQNNINTFVKFLNACKKEIDMDYIDYRINNDNNFIYNYYFYEKEDEEGALRLADQIFDNDYDKACFLRQYYKDFSILEPSTLFKRTKRFVTN